MTYFDKWSLSSSRNQEEPKLETFEVEKCYKHTRSGGYIYVISEVILKSGKRTLVCETSPGELKAYCPKKFEGWSWMGWKQISDETWDIESVGSSLESYNSHLHLIGGYLAGISTGIIGGVMLFIVNELRKL